jgi:hypothetical protein
MWFYRSLLLVLAGSSVVLLTATLARTSASVAPAATLDRAVSPPPLNPVTDLAVLHLVDQCVAALGPDRVTWLEMELWQKVQLAGFAFEAEGIYHLAPGHRFRLELRSHADSTEGTLLALSDGEHLWQASRTGSQEWANVTRLNLPDVFALMNGPTASQLRDEFLQRPHFRGILPLIANLRNRLIWVSGETVRRGEAEQFRLVGVWSRETAAEMVPGDRAWPAGLPRQCHLYLDAHTFWPHRLEWWGPSVADGPERLVAQMELRNPIVNHPLAAEQCNRIFTFQPGDVSVEDETNKVAADMTARAQQLLTAQSTAR